MTKIIGCIATFFLIGMLQQGTITKAASSYIAQNKEPSLMELAFLRELHHSILEAMIVHGDDQLSIATRVEKITRDRQNDQFYVTIRTLGYTGPIMPPYKCVYITFAIPPNEPHRPDQTNQVIRYHSQPITIQEFSELSRFSGY